MPVLHFLEKMNELYAIQYTLPNYLLEWLQEGQRAWPAIRGVSMRTTYWFALLLSGFCLTLAVAADDDDKEKAKNDKKSKIPPLTFVGNLDGEILYVDTHSDRITLQVTDVVPQWVPNQNGGTGLIRRLNQGGTYVAKEEKKEIAVNMSPDIKIRLMYSQQGGATTTGKGASTGGKKEKSPTAKELAEKDPDYKLGGVAAKKSQLSKGQIVRVSMGRNNDRINPQIYGMVVYVVKEGR